MKKKKIMLNESMILTAQELATTIGGDKCRSKVIYPDGTKDRIRYKC